MAARRPRGDAPRDAIRLVEFGSLWRGGLLCAGAGHSVAAEPHKSVAAVVADDGVVVDVDAEVAVLCA